MAMKEKISSAIDRIRSYLPEKQASGYVKRLYGTGFLSGAAPVAAILASRNAAIASGREIFNNAVLRNGTYTCQGTFNDNDMMTYVENGLFEKSTGSIDPSVYEKIREHAMINNSNSSFYETIREQVQACVQQHASEQNAKIMHNFYQMTHDPLSPFAIAVYIALGVVGSYILYEKLIRPRLR